MTEEGMRVPGGRPPVRQREGVELLVPNDTIICITKQKGLRWKKGGVKKRGKSSWH